MPDRIQSYRRIQTTEGINGEIAFAPPPFRPSNVSFVFSIDPSVLLQSADSKAGYQQLPIGEALQKYRFDKMVAASASSPVDMPSVGFGGFGNTGLALYDADLVHYLIEQGVHDVPVCVTTSDEDKLESLLQTLGENRGLISFDTITHDIYQGQEPDAEGVEGYTNFVSIEELENIVNAHIRTLNFDEAAGKERDNDLYRNFSSTPEMLDALILMGANGANIDKHWDGDSVVKGMSEQIEILRHRLTSDNISGIELVDRYARLYQRKDEYDRQAETSKIFDQGADTHLKKALGFLAQRIEASAEALNLAKTELSGEAQHYLAASLGRTTFTPSLKASPKPTV